MSFVMFAYVCVGRQICVEKCPDRFVTLMQAQKTVDMAYYRQYCVGHTDVSKMVSVVYECRKRWRLAAQERTNFVFLFNNAGYVSMCLGSAGNPEGRALSLDAPSQHTRLVACCLVRCWSIKQAFKPPLHSSKNGRWGQVFSR